MAFIKSDLAEEGCLTNIYGEKLQNSCYSAVTPELMIDNIPASFE